MDAGTFQEDERVNMSEPTISMPFAIGETVWHVGGHYRDEYPVCPDCAGTKFVTMVLGNGTTHTLDCACCGGYNPPTGRMKVSRFVYEPEEITLARVTGFDKGDVEYTNAPEGASCYNIFNSSNMFRDKAACEAVCEKKRIEKDAAEEKNALARAKSRGRSMAYSVSYWRSQAARHKQDWEDAERRLNAAKKTVAPRPTQS